MGTNVIVNNITQANPTILDQIQQLSSDPSYPYTFVTVNQVPSDIWTAIQATVSDRNYGVNNVAMAVMREGTYYALVFWPTGQTPDILSLLTNSPLTNPAPTTTPVLIVQTAQGSSITFSTGSVLASGTKRASEVNEMYSITPPLESLNIDYFVGKKNSLLPSQYSIYNKSLNNNIEVTLAFPIYIDVDKPSTFILAPLSTVTITLTLDQMALNTLVMSGKKISNDDISISVLPLGITGPVGVLS